MATSTMMMTSFDLGIGWILAISGCGYFLTTVLLDYFSTKSKFLRSQPSTTFSSKSKWWLPSSFQAGIDAIKHTREMILNVYTTSPHPFTLPHPTSAPILLLPLSKLKPLLQKSDDEVDLKHVLTDVTASKYTGDLDITLHRPLHFDIVKNQLTRKLPLFTEAVLEALIEGFKEEWGVDGEWRKVKVWGSCMGVVSRGANRIFSGVELCRNQEFLKATRDYTTGVFALGGITGLAPRFLKPLVARYLAWRNSSHFEIAQKRALPIIENRLQAHREGKSSEENVALDWIIEEAMTYADPAELEPVKLCRRLVRLNMVAIHTTSMTVTNTLLDLYTSPRKEEFVAGIREEVRRVLDADGGTWTKQAINDLVRVDSAIKESMRLSTFLTIGVTREVTKREGVDLGDDLHIPPGVRVSFPIGAIHRDPQFYSNPDDYDAFRFAQTREEVHDQTSALEKRRQGVVSTTDTFLGFGSGRHACPGRFFAAQEMKLMLAHIVLQYDVVVEGERPESIFMGGASVPDPGVEIWVRKRVEKVERRDGAR